MTSRYCYCPMTSRKLGRRVTLADRIRKWKIKRKAERDLLEVFNTVGYFPDRRY